MISKAKPHFSAVDLLFMSMSLNLHQLVSMDSAKFSSIKSNLSRKFLKSHLKSNDTVGRFAEILSGGEAMQHMFFTKDLASNRSDSLSSQRTGQTAYGFITKGSRHPEIAEHGNYVSQSPVATSFTGSGHSKDVSVTWPNECNTTLCKVGVDRFLVNAAACTKKERLSINTTRSFSLGVIIQPEKVRTHGVLCRWTIERHTNYYLSVHVSQLADEFIGNFDLYFTEIGDRGIVIDNKLILDRQLKGGNYSFLSDKTIRVRIKSDAPFPSQVITVHFDVRQGTYICDLPVVMLSSTVGYVTSPGFDDNQKYPNNYDGTLHINVARNESLLLNFIKFHLQLDEHCKNDHLRLTELAQRRRWTGCRWMSNIFIKVYHYSLDITFHSDESIRHLGFKIMFAIVLRSQEPKKLPNKLLNCSVSSFTKFKPVFSCNLFIECDGGEDEQDCGYRKNDCGTEAIETDTKCYHLVLHQRYLTWFDAHNDCVRRGHKLATLENPDEFRQFKAQVPRVVDLTGYFVGAHLQERLQPVSITALYRNIWQWVDGRTIFSVQIHDYYKNSAFCAFYDPWLLKLNSVSCHKKMRVAAFVCEVDKNVKNVSEIKTEVDGSVFISPTSATWNVSIVMCPSSHMTRDFLSCDFQSDCGASQSVTSCSVWGVTVQMFVCEESRSAVHYTLVCDYIKHCSDNSDEEFCKYPKCSSTSLKCRNGQCIDILKQCDGNLDCDDGSDEMCHQKRYSIKTTSPPGSVYLDGRGNFQMERMNDSDECPPTHFQCPRGFCLPVYLRCNDIDDCVGREDEVGCNGFICHGFYRCRGTKTCLHPEHVCDGFSQCPQQDDELLCDLFCPNECRCQGLAFVCLSNFSAASNLPLRYLDANGSNITLIDVLDNIHLIALHMSKCRIINLPSNMTFPNLRKLDLSWNKLYRVDMQLFQSLQNLKELVLRGNPLVQITKSEPNGSVKLVLKHVDLSYTNLVEFSSSLFTNSPNIQMFNISWCKKPMLIAKEGFRSTPRIQIIDLRGCELIQFPKDLLRNLMSLQTVHAENYKLCCEAMLPVHFKPKNCHATQDLLASCEDLLKSNSYRMFLWIFASLSLVGNVFSVGARFYQQDGRSMGSFSVFVTNLSVADFLMGVYLAIIGTADLVYRGRYLWRDDEWKKSTACNIGGFFCLLSSETSAFIICLITLDRFLVLRFPFSELHFGRRSALAASGIVWVVGISLAVTPLLPVTSHWNFYSQTGICIPLPFTSREFFRGYDYSFGVSILLNLFLFLLIAVGQAIVYWAVRANSLPSSTNTQARDAAIARRLITVVVSDFLCWFPIGLLGLLASTGTPIPGDLNVAVATFVLPVNSALNPFLYTFNLLMEKRRKAQTAMLLKRLEQERHDQVKAMNNKTMKTTESVDKATILRQIKAWVGEKLLTQEDLLSCSPTFHST